MLYIRKILIISLLCCPFCVLAAQSPQETACLEQGKKEFAMRDFVRAKTTFARCVSLDVTNEEAWLSLAGVQMKQEDLEGAKNSFLTALKHMKRSSPYISYTYSMLGDIALKQQQNKDALSYYNRSLTYNEANVNSLVGKAVIIEAQGDKKQAASIYETALSVEPLNLIARKRLIALEPIYFSDEQILEGLKQRYAALPDKQELSEEDRTLFAKIHSAEQRGGIEYLRNKYSQLPPDYTVTLFKDTDFSREVLTLSGYTAMKKQIGQDAVAVFQKAKVRTQDVFDLRDLKGNKIFLPDSTLTESGFFVYNEALQGRKAFLLPIEAVPPTKEELAQVEKRAKQLTEKGYKEISLAELAMIKKQTNCSEYTLRNKMGLYSIPVDANTKRYFVIGEEVEDPKYGVAWHFVARHRARRNPSIEVPSNSLVETLASFRYTVCSPADGDLLE